MKNVWILQVNDYDCEEIVAVWDHKPTARELKDIVINLSKHYTVDYLPDIFSLEINKIQKGYYSVEVEGSDLCYTDYTLGKFEVIKGGK